MSDFRPEFVDAGAVGLVRASRPLLGSKTWTLTLATYNSVVLRLEGRDLVTEADPSQAPGNRTK